MTIQPLPARTSCLEGKIIKRPFSKKGNRSKGVLMLIYTDVCGHLNVRAKGGFKYFIIFIDDYSRYGYVYLFYHKSETFEKFKEF